MGEYSSEPAKRWLVKYNLHGILAVAKFLAEIRRNATIFSIFSAIRFTIYRRIKNYSGSIISFQPRGWKTKVIIRNCESDIKMLKYVLMEKYHLPTSEMHLPENPIILDLGCNLGIASAHFSELMPKSSVIGYELDAENYQLAITNTEKYQNVKLINAGVWTQNETVYYRKSGRQDSYKINRQKNKQLQASGELIPANGFTLGSIFEANNLEVVDYLKMDIEGMEKLLFSVEKELDWMKKVRFINVEFHLEEGEKLDAYVEVITNCGFKAEISQNHFCCITAENVQL